MKRELRGRDLVCWCFPLTCHGEILLRIANEETTTTAERFSDVANGDDWAEQLAHNLAPTNGKGTSET